MTSEQVEETETQKATASVGEQLKSARIAQGREPQAVAAALHLDESTILALEADDQQSLPAAIFVQGYIQNYARFLGIATEPLLALYKQSAPMAPALEVRGPQKRVKPATSDGVMRFGKRRSSVMPLLTILGLLLIMAGWWLWPQLPSLPVDSDGESSVTLLPMENSSGSISTTVSHLPKTESPREPLDIAKKMPAAIVPIPSEPVVKIVPVVVLDQLVISSKEDSWIEIFDAEQKRVMYRLLRGGRSHEIEGVAPFKVLLGYAQGVELTINGQPFDVAPYIVKNSARFSVERP